MKLLVTGGAGYIGSVVAAKLVATGHEVTVLDDLSTGFADAVPSGATFIKGTLRADAKAALSTGTDAVLHFAAYSQVGESVANPAKYWSNNLGGTLALLEAMRTSGTRRIVFSSTAAAYGNELCILGSAPRRLSRRRDLFKKGDDGPRTVRVQLSQALDDSFGQCDGDRLTGPPEFWRPTRLPGRS